VTRALVQHFKKCFSIACALRILLRIILEACLTCSEIEIMTLRFFAGLLLVLWTFFSMPPCFAHRWPILSYGEHEELNITGPLTPELRANDFSTVKILGISEGADGSVLDNRAQFHNLLLVNLATLTNPHFLEALVKNHAGIAALSISQTKPLSVESMSLLRNFRRLEYLELNCPIEDANQVGKSLPQTLVRLKIIQSCHLKYLNNLRQLDVVGCSVDQSFFEHLDAPNLEVIDLTQADVESEALKGLGKFHHLKELSLCLQDENERAWLTKLTHAHVSQPRDFFHAPPSLVAPLRGRLSSD